MRFIVRIPELDSALYESDGRESHEELFHLVGKLFRSGKLVDGGLLADDRGGFLLMEADSCSEHEALLKATFDSSRYHVESHPILSLSNLKDLFKNLADTQDPLKPRFSN